jgi:hypothetical protein
LSALERFLLGALIVVGLLVAGWLGLQRYGALQYQAGEAAAVAAGKEARDSEAAAALAIESGLRTRLLEQDTAALRKEEEYAANLETAQRRVRAGTDRLLCPAANPVPAAPAPGGRPIAAGPAADGQGPDIVPEAAAAILGDGADVAGLVRRYERVVERFEDCRAVNAVP